MAEASLQIPDLAGRGGACNRRLDAALATIPQDRFADAEECVGAYLFLALPARSGYIIGQVIEVNGGQLMP